MKWTFVFFLRQAFKDVWKERLHFLNTEILSTNDIVFVTSSKPLSPLKLIDQAEWKIYKKNISRVFYYILTRRHLDFEHLS